MFALIIVAKAMLGTVAVVKGCFGGRLVALLFVMRLGLLVKPCSVCLVVIATRQAIVSVADDTRYAPASTTSAASSDTRTTQPHSEDSTPSSKHFGH
jgi:hypothetical protein